MKKLVSFVFFAMWISNALNACSCFVYSHAYFYNLNDFVFKGTIDKIRLVKHSNYQEVTFKIQMIYKGEHSDKKIKIKMGLGGGDCGWKTSKNTTWIVYSKDKTTSECHGTYNIEKGTFLDLNIDRFMETIQKDSIYTERDSKGRVLAQGKFINNLAEGKWKYYAYLDKTSNSSYFYEYNYIKGKQEGQQIEQYGSDVIYYTHYKSNKRNGSSFQKVKDNLTYESNYLNDIVIGDWIEYDSIGNINQRKIYNKKGQVISIKKYKEKQLISLQTFEYLKPNKSSKERGQAVIEKQYDQNGVLNQSKKTKFTRRYTKTWIYHADGSIKEKYKARRSISLF